MRIHPSEHERGFVRPFERLSAKTLIFVVKDRQRMYQRICCDTTMNLMERGFSEKHDHHGSRIGTGARPGIEIHETAARLFESGVKSAQLRPMVATHEDGIGLARQGKPPLHGRAGK